MFTTQTQHSAVIMTKNSATKPRLECGQKCHFAAGKHPAYREPNYCNLDQPKICLNVNYVVTDEIKPL